MIVLQSKEILDIKKLIKKLFSNNAKNLVLLTPNKLLASHFGSIYANKSLLSQIKNK